MGQSDRINHHMNNWAEIYPELDVVTPTLVQRCIWIARIANKRLLPATRRGGMQNRSDYETLLVVFHARPESLSPAEIASELEMSTSGMTGRLDRLQATGLIERKPDPKDRRVIRIGLTPEGEATVRQVFDGTLLIQTEMLASLSPAERKTLSDLLGKVLQDIES